MIYTYTYFCAVAAAAFSMATLLTPNVLLWRSPPYTTGECRGANVQPLATSAASFPGRLLVRLLFWGHLVLGNPQVACRIHSVCLQTPVCHTNMCTGSRS